jgi:hypothetical protein
VGRDGRPLRTETYTFVEHAPLGITFSQGYHRGMDRSSELYIHVTGVRPGSQAARALGCAHP